MSSCGVLLSESEAPKQCFFNQAFTCIFALNRLGKIQNVETALLALNRILRYRLDSETAATLLEECRALKDYLDIQRLRYPGRLTYRFRISRSHGFGIVRKFLLLGKVEQLMERALEQKLGTYHLKLVCTSGPVRLKLVETKPLAASHPT